MNRQETFLIKKAKEYINGIGLNPWKEGRK